ncbi:hypothetical protein HYW99_03760 [Candidatus Woesearchaeota archaeon]|nr:hypothetical protein [Candidatus Woesearchaeota archaeon]
MKLKIPKLELEKLQELAVLPYESSFLIRAILKDDGLDYLDMPLIFRGERNSAKPVPNYPQFQEVHEDSWNNNYWMIDGHTHARKEGEFIIPYVCGWTLPRTEELRNYRNRVLNQTEAGRKALLERQQTLGDILRNDSKERREELAQSLIDHMSELAIANFINSSGIDFYITNRVDPHDPEETQKDIHTRGGDFKGNQGRIEMGIKAIALVHADPKFVYAPSSREKFVLSVLHLKGSDYKGVERIPIEITQ